MKEKKSQKIIRKQKSKQENHKKMTNKKSEIREEE